METRPFGATDLRVSVVGFGAWAIGGPATSGAQPIGWGHSDDAESETALRRALELGIRFVDTADIYGLGHSEELVGRVVGNRPDVVVATKVGQLRAADGSAAVDYSAAYILDACDRSLARLRRERIDFYQLHSARVAHLRQGECLEAMERLVSAGKVRYWGLSLNTFRPAPEAEFLMERRLGHGFQLVLNVVNQRAAPIVEQAAALGYGVIARMPLQFGLLTGKLTPQTRFAPDDHRSFRLTPALLRDAIPALAPFWELADARRANPTALSLGFAAGLPGVSTVIPGIRTPQQAEENSAPLPTLDAAERQRLRLLGESELDALVDRMERPAAS